MGSAISQAGSCRLATNVIPALNLTLGVLSREKGRLGGGGPQRRGLPGLMTRRARLSKASHSGGMEPERSLRASRLRQHSRQPQQHGEWIAAAGAAQPAAWCHLQRGGAAAAPTNARSQLESRHGSYERVALQHSTPQHGTAQHRAAQHSQGIQIRHGLGIAPLWRQGAVQASVVQVSAARRGCESRGAAGDVWWCRGSAAAGIRRVIISQLPVVEV